MLTIYCYCCAHLVRLAVKKSKSHPGAEKSVRLAVSMLAVLQYIEVVQGDKDFYALWQAVLQALQVCVVAVVCCSAEPA